MCTVCGCGASRVEPSRATERNRAADGTAPQARPHEHLHHDHHHHHRPAMIMSMIIITPNTHDHRP